jgi:MFS family permease
MADNAAPIKASNDAVAVLIASVLLLMVTVGGMFLLIVALTEIAQEFGWPRAVPSLALSLQFVGSGIGGILMGYVLDRVGMGVPALVGLVMVGAGAILVSGLGAEWELYVIYGFMFGLSGPSSTVTPAMINITRWFEHRRGMAVGIVASGQGLAGMIWPPVFSRVMEAVGWRDMFFFMGCSRCLPCRPFGTCCARSQPPHRRRTARPLAKVRKYMAMKAAAGFRRTPSR